MKPEHYSNEQLLRRYADGSLTAPEERELEHRAAGNTDLRAAYLGIFTQPGEDHQSRLASIRARTRGQRQSTMLLPWPKVIAVAATLLLVFTTYQFWSVSPEDATVAMETLPLQDDQVQTPARTKENEPETGNEGPEPPESTLPETAAETTASSPETPRLQTAPAEPTVATAPPAPTPKPAQAETTPLLKPEPVARTYRSRESPLAAASDLLPPVPRIVGRVLDEAGAPLPGVQLELPGLLLDVTTDSAGRFLLDVNPTVAGTITFRRPGYESEFVELDKDYNPLQITLQEITPVEADELVGAASTRLEMDDTGNFRQKIVVPNAPVAVVENGYRFLKQRVEEGKPAEVAGRRARVSFLVNPGGELTDFKFRGRPSSALRDYVIRAVTKASGWSIQGPQRPVRVSLRLRFD